jgi:hypothetical protein
MARSSTSKPRKPAGKVKSQATRRVTSVRKAAPRLPMPEVLLKASSTADLVEVPARSVVSIDGAGGPEQEGFGRGIGALYGAAYGLKFSRKPSGRDFKIGPLEGRWWAEGAGARFSVAPRSSWRWRLRIGVPEDVQDAEVAEVIRAATSKKGGKLEGSADAARVRLERIPARSTGRILHVGPYADEPASFEKIRAALAAAGQSGGRAHLEVYLSDPRRTRPEKLKTVLLLEVDE